MIPKGEALRKAIHIGAGLFAALLRYLETWQAVGLAALGVGFNAAVLPRLTRGRLERVEDRERGYARGILLYPVSVLLLLLLLPGRPEVVAAAWGILAFGDGMGTLVGRLLGGRALPWNPEKTLAGSMGFFLFGSAAAALLYRFVAPAGSGPVLTAGWAVGGCVLAAAVAAAIEGYPSGIDDNLTVPLSAAGVLFCLTWIEPGATRWADRVPQAGLGAVVNGLLAAGFRRRGWVDRSGATAGFLLGTIVFALAGWRAYALLLLFFAVANGATRIGLRRKEVLGIAQAGRGARSARHAMANCGLASFLFAVAGLAPGAAPWFRIAGAAALATAALDTVSSEIGKWFGRGTVRITTWERVLPGTEGGVSAAGTAAGIAAGAILAAAAHALALVESPAAAGLVLAAAVIGGTAESILGASLEPRHGLDNETLNFLNTLIGALVAVFAWRWIR